MLRSYAYFCEKGKRQTVHSGGELGISLAASLALSIFEEEAYRSSRK